MKRVDETEVQQEAAKGTRKANKSIAMKVLTRVIPVTVIALVLVVVVMVTNTTGIVASLSSQALEQESEKDGLEIENELIGLTNAMNATVDGVVNSDMKTVEQMANALKPSMSVSKMSPNGIYIGLANGDWIDPSGWVPDDDYVITERDWYKKGIDSDTFVMGDPYVDEETGSVVVTISKKVNCLGSEGVAAFDINLDSIVNKVGALKPMKTGGSVLISTNNVLSYFHKEDNGKTISEVNDSYLNKLKSLADQNTKGARQVKSYDGNQYTCVFTKISGTDWTLISSVNSDTVYAGVQRISIIAIVIAIVAIIVISLLLLDITRRMVAKPVTHLTKNIMKIASGDFTKSDDADGTELANDEIGQMNGSMGRFVQGMHKTLLDITDETSQLASAAKDSASESGTLNEQAAEQSQSMDQISDTMNGMASAVTELAENATKLAEEVNQLTEQGNNTSETVKDMLDKADKGQTAMSNVETEISGLSSAMIEMNTAVEEVGKSAEQITSIIEMINSISDQTNLLSLNASIEAARAGEAGKGFAVVASEIGQLANDSSDATKQISDIIDQVSEKIQSLAEKASQNMESIKAGSEAVSSTGETFRDIFKSLDDTGNTVNDMIERVGKVNDIASSVAAIAEEQSASTEEVTATVDTLTATAQKVADSSKKVNESAETVNNAAETIENYITKFKL
ncbi:MAG: methyl-accepting chemotaxis protein [Lachnospiraceae bacterium]|nr:methyl-accepting chemotaxis protein [Lachnospiraceae bacterium]